MRRLMRAAHGVFILVLALTACETPSPSGTVVATDERRGDPIRMHETGTLTAQGSSFAVGVREIRATFEKAMRSYEREDFRQPSYCTDFAAGIRNRVAAGRMLRPLANQMRSLAERGDAEFQYMLGEMYGNGVGVERSDTEAGKWYRKAAEQGHAKAQDAIASYHYSGLGGLNRDYGEAIKWFTKAAKQGIADAQTYLGLMYLRGEGVPQDDAEAAKWFRVAAEQGEANAYSLLGTMYWTGSGVTQDDAEAVKWYGKAAAKGDRLSQIHLGEAYFHGRGVTQDYARAATWFRAAAEAGYVEPQFFLGVLYEGGLGVPHDYALAHMWFNLAAKTANKENLFVQLAIGARDTLAAKMPPGQIAEAQRLAREWKPKRCGTFGGGSQ